MQKHNSLALIFLAALFIAPSAMANAWIEKVYVRYEPAQNFKRISEYFTGKENTGDRHIPKGGSGNRWDLVDLI